MTYRSSQFRARRGSVAVLSAFLIVGLLAMVAFAVDLGYIMVAKADLQLAAADAAAHAAAMKYASDDTAFTVITDVRSTAREYVGKNNILKSAATVSLNTGNADLDGDIVVGKLDFSNPSGALQFSDPDQYNAVRVRVRRTNGQNGSVPLFFARVLGHDTIGLEATATAAIIRQVRGFRIPDSGENVPVLPIVIKRDYWNSMLSGTGTDDYTFNPDGTISPGADSVKEIVIFPDDTTSGNFGTVNIGHSQNSNALLSNQVRHGLSASDLAQYNGEFKLDYNGDLPLGGDTGIDASLKDDLQAIAGVPRIIPLYSSVANPGNNASYNIVSFVGIRIMFVRLTGGNKKVIIQPAKIKLRGLVHGDATSGSEKIFSPAILVQ